MKKTLYVTGMDCISCETILHDALEAVPCIEVVGLSHKTGKITIKYKEESDVNKLTHILADHGYVLQEEKENKKNAQNRVEQFAIGISILTLFWVFMQLDLTQYISDYSANMSLGVAFLVGLVACGSSCLAVTGGIVVSYVEALEDKNRWHLAKVQGLFHVGRILAFLLGGAILGSIGKTFQISPLFNAVFMIVVGVILVYVGLQIFGLLPSITKRGFHLPGGTQKLIKQLNHPNYALIVGALTFFLPCGFTQSMQLFAMQTGSATQGALMLGAYGLGTIPLLLGLGMSAGYFKAKMAVFNKVVAGLLVVFGLVTLTNGRGASQNVLAASLEQQGSDAVTETLEENSTIERLARPHLGNRLEPKNILLQTNTNYEITIHPSMNGIGCKSLISLPNGKQYRVEQGIPITFNFMATEKGTYKLPCGVGSSHGSIVVESKEQ